MQSKFFEKWAQKWGELYLFLFYLFVNERRRVRPVLMILLFFGVLPFLIFAVAYWLVYAPLLLLNENIDIASATSLLPVIPAYFLSKKLSWKIYYARAFFLDLIFPRSFHVAKMMMNTNGWHSWAHFFKRNAY